MSIVEYTISSEKWDDIIISVSEYYIFFRKNYINDFMDINGEEPILLLYEHGRERAVSVFFKRDVAETSIFKGKMEKNKYFDLMSPYGYGGYTGNLVSYELLNREHRNYCQSQGYISEVVKFHPFSDQINSYLGSKETSFHNVVRLLNTSLDEVWMNYKAKVRKNVKRAISNGLEILIEENSNHLDEFLDIYYMTMDRTNATENYFFKRSFFENICRMNNNYIFFHVRYEDRIIATELVLYDNNDAYSYLGGTDSRYFDLRPNDYLKHEIIKWGIDRKLRSFILGGGHGKDDGIFEYKSSFAPNGIVDFYVGTDVFDHAKYNELCEMRRNLDKNFEESGRPVPAYRF